MLTNSVGLKSGFLAILAALTLSSNFCDIVALIVLLLGTSIMSSADLLLLLFPGILGCSGVVDLVLAAELDELEELDEEDDEDEHELESLSESVCLSVCGGMLPVSESV